MDKRFSKWPITEIEISIFHIEFNNRIQNNFRSSKKNTYFHDYISGEQHFEDTENKSTVEVFIIALDRLLSNIESIQITTETITNLFSSITSPPKI